MTIAEGTYRLGSQSGRLLLRTGRAGVGAKAGHDLTIEVTRWDGSAVVNTADPARTSGTVTVDVGSFEVVAGRGGVKPLTGSDRVEIARTVRENILHTARYPTITFTSTGVEGTPESFMVRGDLTIVGVTQPVSVSGVVAADGRVRGMAGVTQTRWGIKPYSALFGALRLADEVVVEFDLALSGVPEF